MYLESDMQTWRLLTLKHQTTELTSCKGDANFFLSLNHFLILFFFQEILELREKRSPLHPNNSRQDEIIGYKQDIEIIK